MVAAWLQCMYVCTMAALTSLHALSRPKPCWWLWWKPAPFVLQSALLSHCLKQIQQSDSTPSRSDVFLHTSDTSVPFHQTHLGGSEGDDVLDVPPGKAGTDLQHEGHHSGRQGGRSRRASVALRTACPVLHGPVWRHLQRETEGLSGQNTTFESHVQYKQCQGGNSSGWFLTKLTVKNTSSGTSVMEPSWQNFTAGGHSSAPFVYNV